MTDHCKVPSCGDPIHFQAGRWRHWPGLGDHGHLAEHPTQRSEQEMTDSTKLQRPTTAPPLYSQDGKGMDAIVHEHYFIGGCDWLVTEFDPEEGRAFGWACLGDRQNAELGYVTLEELESIAVPLRMNMIGDGSPANPVVVGAQRVERDTGWPVGLTLAEGIAEVDRRHGA